jgi:hypothetical protein
MECHCFGVAREQFSSRSANFGIKQKPVGSVNINMQIFAVFRKGAPANWEQRDDSRQGTTVVNLPEWIPRQESSGFR